MPATLTKIGDRCTVCNGQIAEMYIPNAYWNPKEGAWEFASIEQYGSKASEVAKEKNRKVGCRIRFPEARVVVCGVCKIPFDKNHPLQLQRNAEWQEKDRLASEEEAKAESLKKAMPDATQIARQFNPLVAIEESYERLQRENVELKQRLASLETSMAQMAEVQKRQSKRQVA